MVGVLTRSWWLLVLRGILGVVFGVLAFAWPGLTLVTLVLLFGAYSLVDGIFSIITSITNWKERDDHWLLLLSGLAGVGLGLVTLRTPDITALVLLMFIAAWMLVTGVLHIAAAIRLRKEIQGEFWMILSGILSIVAAFTLWLFPGAGALSVIWVIGGYAIAFGVSLIILGFRLRARGKRLGNPTPASEASGHVDVAEGTR